MRKTNRLKWFFSLEGATAKDNVLLLFSKLLFALEAVILYRSIGDAGVDRLVERLNFPYPLTIKTRYGFLVRATRLIEYVLFTREFEPEVVDRLQVGDEMTFIDVGANYGFYTLYVASRNNNCTVIAIEPLDRVFDALVANVKLNNYRNVKCLNCAAWNKDNINIKLFLNKDSLSNPSAVYNGEIFVSVPARTIDSIVVENAIPRVNWLKIDVESAEAFVLEGAEKTLAITDNVLLEIHTKENGIICEKMLKEAGFKIEALRQTKEGIYNIHACH